MTNTPSLAKHLLSTKAPWASLLVLKPGDSLDHIVNIPAGFAMKTIHGAKCRTTTGLFAEFARALSFPDYFGHNWDALEECLADLEWLPAKGYVLLLNDAEQILRQEEDEYATLLEVLSDAGEAWASGQAGMGERPATPFHVLFTVTARAQSQRPHWGIREMSFARAEEPRTQRRTPKAKR
jgi:RNAse (barnase) inhibitor barstar